MSFLPPTYQSAASGSKSPGSDRYFKPGVLGDGESAVLRMCGTHASGHVIAGWQYFTSSGAPKRSIAFPSDYEKDIGLSWAGKTQGTGEKDKPTYFLSFAALIKGHKEFMVVTLTQKAIREQLEEILSMEDYFPLEGSGVANFDLTLKRKGTAKDTTWLLTPSLRKPSREVEARWLAAKDQLWLPALYSGGDPFAGKPADAGTPAGLPPTARDEHGADVDLDQMPQEEDW